MVGIKGEKKKRWFVNILLKDFSLVYCFSVNRTSVKAKAFQIFRRIRAARNEHHVRTWCIGCVWMTGLEVGLNQKSLKILYLET